MDLISQKHTDCLLFTIDLYLNYRDFDERWIRIESKVGKNYKFGLSLVEYLSVEDVVLYLEHDGALIINKDPAAIANCLLGLERADRHQIFWELPEIHFANLVEYVFLNNLNPKILLDYLKEYPPEDILDLYRFTQFTKLKRHPQIIRTLVELLDLMEPWVRGELLGNLTWEAPERRNENSMSEQGMLKAKSRLYQSYADKLENLEVTMSYTTMINSMFQKIKTYSPEDLAGIFNTSYANYLGSSEHKKYLRITRLLLNKFSAKRRLEIFSHLDGALSKALNAYTVSMLESKEEREEFEKETRSPIYIYRSYLSHMKKLNEKHSVKVVAEHLLVFLERLTSKQIASVLNFVEDQYTNISLAILEKIPSQKREEITIHLTEECKSKLRGDLLGKVSLG